MKIKPAVEQSVGCFFKKFRFFLSSLFFSVVCLFIEAEAPGAKEEFHAVFSWPSKWYRKQDPGPAGFVLPVVSSSSKVAPLEDEGRIFGGGRGFFCLFWVSADARDRATCFSSINAISSKLFLAKSHCKASLNFPPFFSEKKKSLASRIKTMPLTGRLMTS